MIPAYVAPAPVYTPAKLLGPVGGDAYFGTYQLHTAVVGRRLRAANGSSALEGFE